MADTGNPWFIPFAEPSDLVRDWPALSSAVGTAVAAGLSAAGGLVAVKSAIFTGTQTNSTASGANFEVTDLSITHEVADAANKLIISGFVGAFTSSAGQQTASIAVAVDGTLANVGTSVGSRTAVTSANSQGTTSVADAGYANASFTHVYTPGSGSKVYTLRVINVNSATATLYVNRRQRDDNNANDVRAVSSLVIQEVKV
jgi:hypothetical protein